MHVLRVAAIVALLMSAFPLRAAAADIRQGSSVVIGTADTVDDDLYAFAANVAVNGTVNGDVVAMGTTVTVDGTVTGDLIVAATSVAIRGQVNGTVRAAGGTIFVDGRIGEDLFAAGNDVTLSSSSRIGRDAILAGNDTTVRGQVARNLQSGATTLTIEGRVGGDVRARVDTLRVTSTGAVDGALSYTSDREAQVASGAQVRGRVERSAPPPGPTQLVPGPAGMVIDWLRGLVGLLLLGVFLVLFFPHFSRRAGEAVVNSPFLSLGFGLAVLIGIPLLAIVVFALGALIGGWWLGLVALAFYFAAIAVSVPVAALGLGASIMRITRRPVHPVIALVVGLVVLLLIALVPILGGIVLALAAVFGIGATAMAVATGRRVEPAVA